MRIKLSKEATITKKLIRLVWYGHRRITNKLNNFQFLSFYIYLFLFYLYKTKVISINIHAYLCCVYDEKSVMQMFWRETQIHNFGILLTLWKEGTFSFTTSLKSRNWISCYCLVNREIKFWKMSKSLFPRFAQSWSP